MNPRAWRFRFSPREKVGAVGAWARRTLVKAAAAVNAATLAVTSWAWPDRPIAVIVVGPDRIAHRTARHGPERGAGVYDPPGVLLPGLLLFVAVAAACVLYWPAWPLVAAPGGAVVFRMMRLRPRTVWVTPDGEPVPWAILRKGSPPDEWQSLHKRPLSERPWRRRVTLKPIHWAPALLVIVGLLAGAFFLGGQ